MDPKVCGKLLTTHGEGDDDDDEELRDGSPSGGAPEQAPRWDIHGNRRYGGGIRVFSLFTEVLGYVDLYRKKAATEGRSRGPRGRGARPRKGGAPPPSRAGPTSPDLAPKTLERDFLQKYLSRRFHSVWTPFDIPFCKTLK